MTVRPRLGARLLRAGLAAALLSGCADAGGETEPPVITPQEAWDALPTAHVIGPLTLRDGCLLLDGEVVFWPRGTTWDASTESVVPEEGDPVAVGGTFDGGGGHYSADTDFESLLGDQGGRAVESCLEKTRARGVVLAYGTGDPE